MKKQFAGVLLAIGVLFLITAFAQSTHSPQQLAVYDSNGKRVGAVVGGEYTFGSFLPMVPFKVQGVPMMLLVFQDSFAGHDAPVWESTDCSGNPFIPSGTPGYVLSPSSLPLAVVGVPGNTVYVQDGAARSIVVRSSSTLPLNAPFGRPGLPPQCEPWNAPSPRTVVPARALVDLNTQFNPPFAVR